MRQFNNYEAVQINNTEEAMEFFQYLEDNTDLKFYFGEKLELPFFFKVKEDALYAASKLDYLEDETKIIQLSEFLEPKATYTREQADKVLEDEIEKINSKLGSILIAVTELRRNLTKVINDKKEGKEGNERVG